MAGSPESRVPPSQPSYGCAEIGDSAREKAELRKVQRVPSRLSSGSESRTCAGSCRGRSTWAPGCAAVRAWERRKGLPPGPAAPWSPPQPPRHDRTGPAGRRGGVRQAGDAQDNCQLTCWTSREVTWPLGAAGPSGCPLYRGRPTAGVLRLPSGDRKLNWANTDFSYFCFCTEIKGKRLHKLTR